MARLMIVDDDEDFVFAVSEALRIAGHDVACEPDTRSALAAMHEHRPDLVILDVMFPQGSSGGFDLARTMRHESGDLREIPILMLTAVGQRFPFGFGPSDIGEDSLPVDIYLEKPVEPDLLSAEIARLLARGRADAEAGPPP